MYYDNKSFAEMYAETKIPKRKIQKFFKDKEMSLVKRYHFDEHYFEDINSADKAYWLGYMYCDGFVGDGKYNNIVLSSIDENVIDKFISDLSFDDARNVKKIVELTEKRKSNSFAKSILHEARFSSKQMKKNLSNRNIFPHRKTLKFLDYHGIETKYLMYILFGFLDADAYISYSQDSNNRRIAHLFSSKELLIDYETFLSKLNIKYTVKHNQEKDCYYLRISFNDNFTSSIMEEFKKISLMHRKFNAPSLSKDSVE